MRLPVAPSHLQCSRRYPAKKKNTQTLTATRHPTVSNNKSSMSLPNRLDDEDALPSDAEHLRDQTPTQYAFGQQQQVTHLTLVNRKKTREQQSKTGIPRKHETTALHTRARELQSRTCNPPSVDWEQSACDEPLTSGPQPAKFIVALRRVLQSFQVPIWGITHRDSN